MVRTHPRRTIPNHSAPNRATPNRTAPAALAVALATALALTGCAGPDTASGAAPADPTPGGTLRFALGAAPQGVDPQQVGSNVSIYVARQLADSLTDQDPETGEIGPWLAESWDVSDDLTEFTFHLRDGVTFSDGSPLTADDVRASFDAIAGDLGATAPLAASYLAGYEKTEVPDDGTATVVFDAPNAQFLQATSTVSLAILSEETAEADPAERLQGDVVGSGPFVLDSYTQDQGAVLTRRDGYNWAPASSQHEGDAYLERIEFSVVPESGVRAGGLASDQFDAVGDVLPQDVPQVEGSGGGVLTRANPGVPFVLQPNLTRPPLDDPEVRRALLVAIDRQELVDTVLSDAFKPATGVLASTTPGYTDLSDELAFDPDEAAKILDEAGWTEGPDGIRVKDGEPLEIEVTYTPVFTGSTPVLELAAQQLRAVGVDLKLRQLTAAEQTTAQDSGDYDFFYYNVTRADADILRTQFSTAQRNLSLREPDDVVDPLLDEQLGEADPAARDALVADAQRAILDEGLAIPLFELAQSIGVRGDVHGVTFDASSRLLFHDAWIEQE
ncbi:peptide/nickel transport system substrate-binding protein [Promicromonospora sp. AC04]|uniref:ABC transporter substrate-binding protein n=1 Tax=Promicromonospora sp. AC04 TaxID=2135723 RepID=UPI000D341EE5|nr:ABC transporter substrate-binding protein [Promicromonospora sp. AC04]PUB25305.1 peptide/nickel transport system substrate-binding protein [Promicromonospora sp. AC04]